MNKTVSANLSGVIFNIDEAAYEKLLTYLNTIRGYFNNSEGCEEIMADIEARIAEMLQEKLGDKQVVSMQNVEDVISVMGQPEDYLDEEMKQEANGTSTSGKNERTYGKRRLYRDPESNVAGGVCSGIGYYFGFDPLWLRLAFVAIFLFFGSGLILYIILWIIIPKAETAAERLEMKGEPVNASNIGKTIEEEIEKVKTGFNNIKQKHKRGEGASNAVERFFEFVFDLFKHLAKAVGKLLGFVFFVGGIIVLVSFVIALISGITFTPLGIEYPSGSMKEIVGFFSGGEDFYLILTGILLLCGVPILGIIYSGLKLLFNIKDSPKVIGITLTSLWLAGLVLCIYLGLNISSKYRAEEFVDEVTTLPTSSQDTLYLEVGKTLFEHSGKRANKWGLEISGNKLQFQDVDLDVVRSKSDSFEIVVVKSAMGTNKKDAQSHIRQIDYNFSIKDSLIVFDTYFETDKKTEWRAQEVEVYIKVPEGKTVHFSKDLDRIIYDVKNVTNMYDGHMVNKYWEMKPKGLTCISCEEMDE